MEENTDEKLSSNTIAAIRGLLLIVLPIVGMSAAVLGTKHGIDSKIESNGQRDESRSEAVNAHLRALEKALDQLRSDFDAHARLGPDGLRHPQGVIRELEDLEERVRKLEGR